MHGCTRAVTTTTARCRTGSSGLQWQSVRFGIKPFLAVEPTARCSWCKEEAGDDLLAHDIECVHSMRGDNNLRHQFLQQALFNILKSVGRGVISLHPLALTFFGSGAHEPSLPEPCQRQREGGRLEDGDGAAELETSRGSRILGISGVLGADSVALIDLTVCRIPKGFRRLFNVVTRSFLKT